MGFAITNGAAIEQDKVEWDCWEVIFGADLARPWDRIEKNIMETYKSPILSGISLSIK